jgi:RNA polymerase sigma-70 factor (ECF subfamily)
MEQERSSTGPGVDAAGLRAASDEELVRRFLAGQRVAFEALVKRHQDRVFGLCVRLLGSSSLAEEAAQDVFVRVYRSLDAFRGDSRFSTWLYRVTLNHCRNVHAYRARRMEQRHDSLDAEVEDEDGAGRKRELADPGHGAEERLLTEERLKVLSDELARLDPLWREILVLRDVEGLSYEEIGTLLDIPPGTVKSRIHRARGDLLAKLERRMMVRA